MVSPSGRCAAFLGSADGLVPAEAVAVVVLASERVIEDCGLSAYARVAGSGVNYDGRTNGITAPSGKAQAELVRSVWEKAGVAPGSVGHVVAHGTGTKLGDPVELNALADVLRDDTSGGECVVTSSKSNVGHSLAASGVVSLIGLVQSLRTGVIPPSIPRDLAAGASAGEPAGLNEYVRWGEGGLAVRAEAGPWPSSSVPDVRIGAVSAFGMSGTNAHVVLEAPVVEGGGVPGVSAWAPLAVAEHVLVVSAATAEALARRIADLAAWCRKHAESDEPGLLPVLAHKLWWHRDHHAHRAAFIVTSLHHAADLLGGGAAGGRTGVLDQDASAEPLLERTLGSLLADASALGSDDHDHCTALAHLYVTGYDPRTTLPRQAPPLPHLDLPGYPFAREHYWAEGPPMTALGGGNVAPHAFVQRNESTLDGVVFRSSLRASTVGREIHCASDVPVVVPDEVLLEMARAAVAIAHGADDVPVELSDVELLEPMVLPGSGAVEVEVVLGGGPGDRVEWQIASVASEQAGKTEQAKQTVDTEGADERRHVYALGFGALTEPPAAPTLDELRTALDGGGEGVLVAVDVERARVPGSGELVLEPGLLPDAVAHAGDVVRIEQARFSPSTADAAWLHVRAATTESEHRCDLTAYDEHGAPLWTITRLIADRSAASVPTDSNLVAVATGETASTGALRRSHMTGWTAEECLAWEVREAIGKVLSIPFERVHPATNFAEFGFDSILLADLAAVLGGRLGRTVTPDLFFGAPTVDRLVPTLFERYGDVLVDAYREAAKPTRSAAPASRGTGRARVDRPRPAPPACGRARQVNDPVAVLGMAGRFPGADDVDALWRLLAEGRDAVSELPADRAGRWQELGFDPAERTLVRAGFVAGVEEFDPAFFQISPREADGMDPRQRLLLQECWHAIEDAGLTTGDLRRYRVAVFVGAEEGDYDHYPVSEVSITANSNAILASRLSYFLGLHGPALATNTACSSGLVAVHQARQAIAAGDCDIAVVAGVNLMLAPHVYGAMARAGMLSATGVCRAFDAAADGMIPAEAVAAVVLASPEVAAGATTVPHATLLATGVNYDGRTNGITAPSGAAQTELLTRVWREHDIEPASVRHLVAHGTGTKLGDPVEVNAVIDALKAAGDSGTVGVSWHLTSTKSNLGHALAASGVVNLIALISSLRRGAIPPTIGLSHPNDYIAWQDAPVTASPEPVPWPGDDVRRGATNAFGMSGTNAHAVVEYRPPRAETWVGWTDAPEHVLVFSARTAQALDQRLADVAAWLERTPHKPGLVAVLSHTLLFGRDHLDHRVAVVVRSPAHAVEVINALRGAATPPPGAFVGRAESNAAAEKVLQETVDRLAATRADDAELHDNAVALARLYTLGYVPSARPEGVPPAPRLDLPGYPFARNRHWADLRASRRRAAAFASTPGDSRATVPNGSAPAAVLPVAPASPVAVVAPVPAPVAPGAATVALAARARTVLEPPERVAVEPRRTLPKPSGIRLVPLPESTVVPAAPVAPVVLAEPVEQAAPVAAQAPADPVAPGIDSAVLEELLVRTLAGQLFVDESEIELDRSFTEMGLDSIVGVEWVWELSMELGVDIESTRLYEHPTVTALAGYLAPLVGSGAGSVPTAPESPAPAVVSADPLPAPSVSVVDSGALEELLVRTLAGQLFVDESEIELDRSFTEMGLDSIVGVEWVRELSMELGVDIESTRLYEHPTVTALGTFLSGILPTRPAATNANDANRADRPNRTDNLDELLEEIYAGRLDPDAADALLADRR
nr:beta-ketoacyl synthase N-terminal-like domain-containing protein [Amycolatopsis anabasis]